MMQTPVLSGHRWKTKDLERLPEEPFLSYEIIDGELIVPRKPYLRHAAIIGELCAQIYPGVRALEGLLLVEPGIVWSEEAEDNVAPNIAIVLHDRRHLATGPALSGTPNVVEIAGREAHQQSCHHAEEGPGKRAERRQGHARQDADSNLQPQADSPAGGLNEQSGHEHMH
jgi:hypothetical protein